MTFYNTIFFHDFNCNLLIQVKSQLSAIQLAIKSSILFQTEALIPSTGLLRVYGHFRAQ